MTVIAAALTNGADEDEHKADDERHRDDGADRMKPNLPVRLAVHGDTPLPQAGALTAIGNESSGPPVISCM
jgi:hypothetical protein